MNAPASPGSRLPIILIAAVIQGWALYALHHAIKGHHWPATDSAWLLGLYAMAILVPATVQLLAEYAQSVANWVIVSAIGLPFFYFGWHYGGSVADGTVYEPLNFGEYFSLAFVSLVLWLLMLPFAQIRIAAGRWAVEYRSLFTNAWRNLLVLAGAALFTGLFWLLLFLWQSLFHMLQIEFFTELFREPIFFYPVTSLAFGCALHLIGSIERLTSVVLFLNAAYRDGTVERPYPKWIALALRAAVPLTVIISATALYALMVRTQHYGFTVERVWAFVVAAAALSYSVGYSLAALGKGAWLAGISRVNVVVAIGLIVVISAALSPIFSPYRLAADSQYRLVLAGPLKATADKFPARSPFHYLRFDAGSYGRSRLQELAQLQGHPDAGHIRSSATQALQQKNPWTPTPQQANIDTVMSKLAIYPKGRTLDADLSGKLAAEWQKTENNRAVVQADSEMIGGLYLDLNGDGGEEFLLLAVNGGLAYQRRAGGWEFMGKVVSDGYVSLSSRADLLHDLAQGDFGAIKPQWPELSVGKRC